jgi:NhaP-type Na+/H+ or K+/H+ antiporter
VSYKDLLKGLALYVFVTTIRFTLIFVSIPLARVLGLKTGFGNASILSLGGIKGGFNIVLALIARFSIKDENVGDLFLFHTIL